MPYKEKDKWRAVVKINKKRYSKTFNRRKDAIQWENEFKALYRRKILNGNELSNPHFNVQSTLVAEDLLEFKQKYQAMYEDPKNTIADIIDCIFKEIEIPVTFNDIKSMVHDYYKNKRKSLSRKKRVQIMERDGYTCSLCGRKPPDVELHVDHIVPRSKGGLDDDRNLQTLCSDCNYGKSDNFILNRMVAKKKKDGTTNKTAK